MYRGLEIICEQYDYSGLTTDINEVNFFSSIEPVLLDTVDLTDYFMRNTDVQFRVKREDMDKVADSIQLFTYFDTLKLSLSGAKSPSLFDFFALDNNDTNGFLNYKILVYQDGEFIFQGVLKPQDLVYNMPFERNDRKIIECTIYGWDKEFKEYFTQGEMPDLSTPVNYWYPQEYLGSYVDITGLDSMLVGLFGFSFDGEIIYDDGIDGGENLGKWRIARIPNLINPQVITNPTFWFMNGYDYIRSNFNLSPFDFFRKLCNAMGWVFYFKIVDNSLKFVVRNRVTKSDFFDSREIDNSDIIGYDTEYSQYRQKVKTIKIPAFEISGGNEILKTPIINIFDEEDNERIKGAYDLVFSKENTPPLEDKIFCNDMVVDFSRSTDKILPNVYFDYGFSKFIRQNDENMKVANQFYDYADSEITVLQNFLNYDVKFLLEIDGGHNNFQADVKRRKNLDDAVATDYRSGDNISDRDLIYMGNIGTAMIREQASSQWFQYTALNNAVSTNYNYTKSAQMKANIEALLTDTSNLILNITVNGFNPYIDEVITFSNPDVIFPFGYEYDIIGCNADFMKDETNYSLRRRVL